MSKLLRIQNLRKEYNDGKGQKLVVLDSISMEFKKNLSYSIVGLSGSGKSTILHLLGGLDHTTKGEVFFEEKNITELSDEKLSLWRNHNVGLIFQFHHILQDFTALENVLMPSLIKGESYHLSEKRAKELLDQVGMASRFYHRPSELSGGEQQRVAIARSLINNPSLLLADEPTGNLDHKNTDLVNQLIQDMCKIHNITLILVTHNLQLASEMNIKLELSDGNLKQSQEQ